MAIGFTIEHFRNRKIRAWALANRGTFHAGTAPLPEAEIFDGPTPPGRNYSRISRFERGDITFITARQTRHMQSVKGEHKTYGHCICLILAPDLDFPQFSLQLKGPSRPAVVQQIARLVGVPDQPSPLAIPDALPEFASRFEIWPFDPAESIEPHEFERVLPPNVQQALLAHPDLLAGLDCARGAVRLRAIEQQVRHPYPELLTLADCLVTLWEQLRRRPCSHLKKSEYYVL